MTKQQTFSNTGTFVGNGPAGGGAVATVKDGEIETEIPSEFAPQATGNNAFEVEYGDQSLTVRARDSIEAFAVFCDTKKIWPPPKAAKVNGKRVGYEAEERAAAAAKTAAPAAGGK